MDDPLFVCGFEGFGDLPGDRQRFVDRHGSPGDAMCEGLALDELHDQRLDAARVFQPIDAGDMRMIQRRQHLGFALKARQPVGVVRDATEPGS